MNGSLNDCANAGGLNVANNDASAHPKGLRADARSDLRLMLFLLLILDFV
jgi:hypothetical protein